MSVWTQEEESFLLEHSEDMSLKELSHYLNKSLGSIRGKRERMGLNQRFRPFTDEEKEVIRSYYLAHPDEIDIGKLAKNMGRQKTSISRYAQKIGLSNSKRSFTDERKQKISESNSKRYVGEEGDKLRNVLSAQSKEWHKKHEHPQGFLGHKHTQKAKNAISKGQLQYSRSLTPQQKQDRVKKAKETRLKKGVDYNTTVNAYSRCKGGYRPDLYQYFRSSWEANIARILNELGIEWRYEFKRFYFIQVDNGVMSYQPDFYLPDFDKWIEVKGWMDEKSKIRLTRFAKEFSEENDKLILIDSNFYYTLQDEFDYLDNWEKPGSYVR